MILTNKYLKYSPEITPEIFTLIWNKLVEYNYNFDKYSKETIYKRFSESSSTKVRYLRTSPNNLSIYPYTGDGGFTEIMVEEILGYNPFIETKFDKQAVHCKTQEEWDFILSKIKRYSLTSMHWPIYKDRTCWTLFDNCCANLQWRVNNKITNLRRC